MVTEPELEPIQHSIQGLKDVVITGGQSHVDLEGLCPTSHRSNVG